MPPGLAFSQNGNRLIGRGGVFDGRSGQSLTTFTPAEVGVYQCALSPDGSAAAVAVDRYTLNLIDAADGRLLAPPITHRGEIRWVAFSPDGQMVVSACDDGLVRMFARRNGEQLGSFAVGHGVLTANFSPDGRRLVVGTTEHSAAVWDVSSDVRPIDDLRRLAEMLSGQRLGQFDNLDDAGDQDLRDDWQSLLTRYPQAFPPMTRSPTTRATPQP
jgi:WD40 repeat protein